MEDNITMDLKETGLEGVNWTDPQPMLFPCGDKSSFKLI
jgi:hypothetical protein